VFIEYDRGTTFDELTVPEYVGVGADMFEFLLPVDPATVPQTNTFTVGSIYDVVIDDSDDGAGDPNTAVDNFTRPWTTRQVILFMHNWAVPKSTRPSIFAATVEISLDSAQECEA
jgi:hypothetical protein